MINSNLDRQHELQAAYVSDNKPVFEALNICHTRSCRLLNNNKIQQGQQSQDSKVLSKYWEEAVRATLRAFECDLVRDP